MNSAAVPIPLTSTTPLSSIAGVVYAKPNVTTNPPSCLFYPLTGVPATTNALYATAASTLSGGQPSNHAGWPGGVPQSALDVNLSAMGFTAGQYVAIAFNLDSNAMLAPMTTASIPPARIRSALPKQSKKKMLREH